MYAASENAARMAFQELKAAMGADAQRAVNCLEKEVSTRCSRVPVQKSLWRAFENDQPD